MAIVLYARVSSISQNLDRQLQDSDVPLANKCDLNKSNNLDFPHRRTPVIIFIRVVSADHFINFTRYSGRFISFSSGISESFYGYSNRKK